MHQQQQRIPGHQQTYEAIPAKAARPTQNEANASSINNRHKSVTTTMSRTRAQLFKAVSLGGTFARVTLSRLGASALSCLVRKNFSVFSRPPVCEFASCFRASLHFASATTNHSRGQRNGRFPSPALSLQGSGSRPRSGSDCPGAAPLGQTLCRRMTHRQGVTQHPEEFTGLFRVVLCCVLHVYILL